MSEKSRRNYPFIGRIYTAEQIDNLIGSIDLSDYYNKSDIDGMLDIIETAIDAKQDELTAGDNIVIENNVISAIAGGNDYIKMLPANWNDFKVSTDYTSFYLGIFGYNGEKQILLFRKKEENFYIVYPIHSYGTATLNTPAIISVNSTSIKLFNIGFSEGLNLGRSYCSFSLMDGTIIDDTNVDNYWDSTNKYFTQHIVMTYNHGNYYYSTTIISKGCDKYNIIITPLGGGQSMTVNLYNVIKNNSMYSMSAIIPYKAGESTIQIDTLEKFYKLEFPTTN